VAARSARDARRAHVHLLQQALAAFSDAIFIQRPGLDVDGITLTLANGDAAPLRDASGTHVYGLAIEIYCHAEPIAGDRHRWGVDTIAYVYQLEAPGDPPREVCGYHWHPHIERIGFPHLHRRPDKTHYPTGGFVTLRDVLALTVREYSVAPVPGVDWRKRPEAADTAQRASLQWTETEELRRRFSP
jgi:hypothetical protein